MCVKLNEVFNRVKDLVILYSQVVSKLVHRFELGLVFAMRQIQTALGQQYLH